LNLFERKHHVESTREVLHVIEKHTRIERPYPMYAEDLVPTERERFEHLYKEDLCSCQHESEALEISDEELDEITQHKIEPKKNETKTAKKNSRATGVKSAKRSNKV
jgi:hypothetical protein